MEDNSMVSNLNQKPVSGNCVFYIISRDQRVSDNHALLEAQQTAVKLKLPLAVVFCLYPKIGNRALEHYQWMLDGLIEVETELNKLSIPFMMLVGDPKTTIKGLIEHTKPAAIYFDFSPLKGPRNLQANIAKVSDSAVYVVDTHNIIPVTKVSDKQEYAARTIRTKIHALLPDYLNAPGEVVNHPYKWPGVVKSISEIQPHILELLKDIPSNGQKLSFKSGQKFAHDRLKEFIRTGLMDYQNNRNDPLKNGLSNLSPYLHFGQISSLRVILEIQAAVEVNPSLKPSADVFLEEIVVRKELSDNFCYYNPNYKSLDGCSNWAKESLQKHAQDKREFIFTFEQFKNAKTNDPAWNAAQMQLVNTGKMHGYMRMYWAKKVLEWSKSADEAVQTLVKLNDFYSLDGGDPNGYVGILWSVGGLHDRPWFERDVYGSIRYMNYNGLKRKFDVEGYIKKYG